MGTHYEQLWRNKAGEMPCKLAQVTHPLSFALGFGLMILESYLLGVEPCWMIFGLWFQSKEGGEE